MKVWVVFGSDGGSDNFPIAAYVDERQARRRVKRENDNQSYYEYRAAPVVCYPKSSRVAALRSGERT